MDNSSLLSDVGVFENLFGQGVADFRVPRYHYGNRAASELFVLGSAGGDISGFQ